MTRLAGNVHALPIFKKALARITEAVREGYADAEKVVEELDRARLVIVKAGEKRRLR